MAVAESVDAADDSLQHGRRKDSVCHAQISLHKVCDDGNPSGQDTTAVEKIVDRWVQKRRHDAQAAGQVFVNDGVLQSSAIYKTSVDGRRVLVVVRCADPVLVSDDALSTTVPLQKSNYQPDSGAGYPECVPQHSVSTIEAQDDD
jgi:hypothetical protein